MITRALGAAAGPAIGWSLVQASWRWVFWLNIPVAVFALVLSARLLTESRDENARSRPDVAGAALLAAGAGLVCLALVKAPDWGWGSAAFAGVLAAGLACGAAMVIRSGRHAAPVLELALLRSRTFSGAFAASLLFYAGFGAFVLTAVEFLNGFWHYSAVRGGLAITPGPLMVMPFARLVAPRLVAFLGGPGRVAAAGCLISAGAQALWLAELQPQPAYLAHLLPALLLAGVGVGLAIPSLLGAGSASLPAARFGTGSGILNTARQIGTVLGVAALVAILAGVSQHDPQAAFSHALVLTIAFYAGAGVLTGALLTGRLQLPARVVPGAPAAAVPEADSPRSDGAPPGLR